MEIEEIIGKLRAAIPDKILNQPELSIGGQEPLISSGLIDSFSLVDVALLVEDLYNIRIEDYELNSDVFDNLEQLAKLILSKTA